MMCMLFKKKKKQEEEDFEVDAYETDENDDELEDEDEDKEEEKEEEKAPLVKPKKQKKTSPVLQKNPIHSYKFWMIDFFVLFYVVDYSFFLILNY